MMTLMMTVAALEEDGKVEILIVFWEICYDNECSTMTTTNMQHAFFLKTSWVPVIQGT